MGAPVRAKQMKTALHIAVNNYPGTDSDLAGCVNDALDWSALFIKLGFQSETITDRYAIGVKWRCAIQDHLHAASSGDLVVVQWSSHGTRVPDKNGDEADGWDEAVVPYDVMENGVITDDELAELFGDRKRGVQLIVIADSCHSGTVSRFAGTTSVIDAVPCVRYLPPETFMTCPPDCGCEVRAGKAPGRKYASLLFAGCQDHEYSYDAWFGNRPNGAFTRAALDVFDRLPAGSTWKDWHAAVRRVLPNSRYPQTPMLYGTTARKNRIAKE